jgi:Transglutaminase-like superfamily
MPGVDQSSLDYYATPGRFTTLDDADLPPGEIADVVDVVQGLLVYDLAAQPFYRVDLTPAQAEAIHERHSAGLVALIRAIDPRPLGQARPPGDRAGARCHAFSRLTVAMLRAAGVPARARCGFGAYFHPGLLEDHWVAEYWNSASLQWQMADAQLDATWRARLSFEGDPLVLTPAEFVTAGHAWQAWRAGDLDAGTCGLSGIDEHGAHWIAHNLRLDLASLNKVEMLPWDVWGAGWQMGEQPTDAVLALFDRVAELTVDPDARFADLRALYETSEALRMDGTVFNVLRGRAESV